MTAKTGTPSVTDCLQADHARLDGLMNDARSLLGNGDSESATAFFGQFRKGLMRHIDVEESLLFPAFEKATGMSQGGPTEVMRREHVEIKRIMGEIETLFTQPRPDFKKFDALRAALVAVLSEHNDKEEKILYPMCDRAIDADGRREIVARMEGN